MKLGTLKNDTRDGTLCVVSRDLKRGLIAYNVAPTLQAALDDWEFAAPRLAEIYTALNRNTLTSRQFEVDFTQFLAPLPRAFGWLDGFGYPSHLERLRKPRGADATKGSLRGLPIAHCGSTAFHCGSTAFISACAPVLVAAEEWGIDLEGKIGAITGDVPMGVKYDKASSTIRLLTLVSDFRLCNVVSAEEDGALWSPPQSVWTSFAPVAVTPDEFGDDWDTRKLKLPLMVHVNESRLGRLNCGTDMAINFPRLIAQAARTHPLGAGTIIGSGPISNKDPSAGVACIAEQRAIETDKRGQPEMPYLRAGDRIRLEVTDATGQSAFGPINQAIAISEPIAS
ncbi:MAG: hypothetical protein EXR39_10480 [Betaproteobacteria bacterium]|nr:hypothetical protein [Betaproteobacteria bacterium]